MRFRRSSLALFSSAALSAAGCVNGTLPPRNTHHPSHPGAQEGYSGSRFGLAEDGKRAASASPQAEPAVQVCPMHPEVVSSTPGTCPKCGMQLVPKPTPPKQGPSATP
jgi:hypothetical protein